jgi:hypothetical protein
MTSFSVDFRSIGITCHASVGSCLSWEIQSGCWLKACHSCSPGVDAQEKQQEQFHARRFCLPWRGHLISWFQPGTVPELYVPTLRLSADYLINKNIYISFWTRRYVFIVNLEMVGLVLLQRRPQRGHREACHREEHYTVTGIKLHFNNFPKYFYIKI